MKRGFKILLAVALLAIIAIAALVWAARHGEPAAIGSISLPDGSLVQLEAVTYGTNHFVGPALAHVADRMPPTLRSWMMRLFGRPAVMRFSAKTDTPKMVLWLNRGPMARAFAPNLGYLECVLADTNGFHSGPGVHYGPTYPLEVKEFGVFPRRDPQFVLNIYRHDATGAVLYCGNMTIANPVYRRYPTWQPESLPVTKQSGDVEVTLGKFRTGLDQNYAYSRQPDGRFATVFGTNRWGEANASVCVLQLRPLTDTNAIWRVAAVETSDATGNRCGNSMLGGDGTDGFVVFAPALWPGEAAWKVRLELKRKRGFMAEEQFTFRDVPLGTLDATNRLGWATNCNGAAITLEHLVRRAPPEDRRTWSTRTVSQLCVGITGLTNGLQLDLISVRLDDGTSLSSDSWSGSATNRTYAFRDLSVTTKAAEFTFAVQRSRWVEFNVKPEVGPLTVTSSRR